ncbi:T9SS type A sorting domain-containing protein [Chryseobacterium sp. PMSZPI]|uniref:T9SS type A sorting domain-containing protein n=1 Tax=Chryseobacterium sp. PMSZPI TaxID=1033900 RepID=UPI000C31FEF9|nr:T9SS type A sorting domain-containing protein [Chryseobacterium sp. PMSZPI]PKF75374.1 hypothetical protein CW752_04400 [Chryseobacterium sp. PMSZPI]
MKRILILFAVCAAIIKTSAQSNYQTTYLAQEQERLDKAAATEVEIENFIKQNINTFDFTSVINAVDKVSPETGKSFSASDYESAVNTAKRQKLRNEYFKVHPEKISLYFAKVLQQCTNGGFEENGGSVSGFTFASDVYNNNTWAQYALTPSTPITPPNPNAILVDNTSPDPNISTIPRVYSGKHAIRLNQPSNGSITASMLSRQFIVNEKYVSFAYALFFQNPTDGGHEKDTRYGYYQVRLKNSTGNIVYQRTVKGYPSPADFNYNYPNNILYSGWRCENIDTSQYLGKLVTLEIIVSNCGNSGHYGYGYFDDFCGLPPDCNVPKVGSISLHPRRKTGCPEEPLNITGNYQIPPNAIFQGSGTGIFLDILEASTGNLVTTLAYPNMSSPNYFSFNSVGGSAFYPSGMTSNSEFNFRVRMIYSIGGINQPAVVSYNTNPPGPDVSFKNCNSPCLEEMYVKERVMVSQTIQASGNIYASSEIDPNLEVTYRAGYSVSLLPGFYVTGDDVGIFHAYIGPCENNNMILKSSQPGLMAKATEELSSPSDIKVYPNPTSGYFKIDTGNEKLLSWEMYDTSGKMVLKGNTIEAEAHHLLKGNYILKISLEKRQITKTVMLR